MSLFAKSRFAQPLLSNRGEPGSLPLVVRAHRGHGLDHDPHHAHEHGASEALAAEPGLNPDKIRVMAAVYAADERLAAATSQTLKARSILGLNIMGAPGVGKTSSIIALTRSLPELKHYVVEGDIESDLDTRTLQNLGVETLQINTHGACHLDAHQIAHAIEDFAVAGPGLLLIENIGNLVCPAEMVIGEQAKILIVTATDGSDKPYKYPLAFEKADLILVNKADLLPYVDFDRDFFLAGVRALNPDVPVLFVNARQGEGFAAVANWVRDRFQTLAAAD